MNIKIVLSIIAAMFSMIVFDPYFIYKYLKNIMRKRRCEKYRDYTFILKNKYFWLYQILSFLITLFLSIIIIEKFSNCILTSILICFGITDLVYVLNIMLCVNKTKIYKVFNYINNLEYRITVILLLLLLCITVVI